MTIDFGGVVNALSGLIWTTRADGRNDFVNRGWCDYTGLDQAQSRDHGWRTAVHPDDLASLEDSWEAIRRTGEAREIYVRLRRFDGEHRWFTLSPSPIPEDTGQSRLWCWLGVNADEGPVTDGRLRRLIDMIPLQVAFLNQAGTSEYSNRQTLDDYGMTLDQLATWQTSGAIHSDDHPIVYEQLTRLMTTGEMFDATLRMRYKDGGYRWMRSRCVPCRDAHGNIARYVTVQSDVHDLKHAEDLLAAEVALLAMVARGTPLSQILDALGRHVEALCDDCFCDVLIVAPDGKHFLPGGDGLDAGVEVHVGQVIDGGLDPCSLSIVEKAPIFTVDLAEDPRWRGSDRPSPTVPESCVSCSAIPIISTSGEASGVVALYRRERVASTLQERELIDRFAKIAGIAIDRAQADAALKASEKDLREAHAQLIEGQRLNKTGSFTSDIQQDRHRWSDEFYRIFEIDPATPPRLEAVRARVHPDDLRLYDQTIQRGLEGGGADFAFRVLTPEAGLKYIRGVSQVIEHVAGRPVFMGTVQDITDSKLAEAALRTSEAELRRTNAQLTDAHRLSKTGSFTWDVVTDDHTWTEEIFRLFEFDLATRVDTPMMLQAIHPEDLPLVEGLLAGALEGDEFEADFRVLPRSGQVKHAKAVGRRVGRDTDPPVFMGAVQDVTASKVAEESLNRARSELAHVARVATLNAMTASITHEVSQPLSGILTNASTCLRMLAADPPDVQGASDTARRTIRDADRATEIIKRLRSLFGKAAPAIDIVELNEAAREVIAISSTELRMSRVVVETRFADGLPAVRGDRVQLQQVILNLILNAADAMATIEDRPRTLAVTTEADGSDGVRILVRDVGVGLDPATHAKLFDAFYTTKTHGMGIGLSISRSIIESHAGRLWATANDGPGATFGFSVPGPTTGAATDGEPPARGQVA